jgi:hypothetical protein
MHASRESAEFAVSSAIEREIVNDPTHLRVPILPLARNALECSQTHDNRSAVIGRPTRDRASQGLSDVIDVQPHAIRENALAPLVRGWQSEHCAQPR